MNKYEKLADAPVSQMTVREQIAAGAMIGYLSGRNTNTSYDTQKAAVAAACVAYADALIMELVK